MAVRYYLEIYPNSAANNSALYANGERFIHGYTGRAKKKADSGLLHKVQTLFSGIGKHVSDEQGSVDLGFFLNRSKRTDCDHKAAQYGPETDVYIPDMKFSMLNR
jgi:hypothetical protein